MGIGPRARYWRIVALAMAIVLGLGIFPAVVTPGAASAQADEISQREFDDLIEAAQNDDPIYGPEEGELEHDPDIVTLSYAEDIVVDDFLATAVFSNPYAGSRNQFDYGIQFRIFEDADGVFYLRFIVLSTTDWAITDSDGEIVVQGVYDDLEIGSRDENELTLYAEGDTLHLGINGDYVGSAEVDNEAEGEIAVGTAFFGDSFQEDAASEFFEFTIWEVGGTGGDRDETLGRRDEEPDSDDEAPTDDEAPPAEDEDVEEPEATEEDEDEEPAPPDEDVEPAPTEAEDDSEPAEEAEGARYESPTFGYTFEYDASWDVRTETTNADGDLIEISNGPSSIQFYGFETDGTPTECVDAIITSLETNESVASVELALDEGDQEMRGEGEGQAFVVLTVSYAGAGGDTVDFGAFYSCYQIDEGESMLQVSHLALIDDYNAEIESRAAVLETLEIGGEPVEDIEAAEPTPEDDDPTPEDEETTPADDEDPTPTGDDSTPTEELPEGAVAIYLESASSANTTVIGTMAPAGTRAEITLFVLLAEPGADYTVTINTGSCANPGPVEYEVGAVDATGLLEGTVDATVEELSNGDYIMVLALASSPDVAVACNNLSALADT